MKNRNIVFDGSCYDYLMRVNGFSCGFNMPPALSGNNTFSLPPYAKRMPYLVDKYPACPEKWMRSEGKIKSYFVPVSEGYGMWLDLNDNNYHTHHVAIVISIQGVNPITGMPCKDAHLEQYIEECPKHKIKFGADRYCKKCDYKWPKQNYITTTATPEDVLWIDGFRSIDGIVRQYILTEEKIKGVATHIIGKDRVYAIGLSFFVSKEKKPIKKEAVINVRGTFIPNGVIYGQPMFFSPVHTPLNWQTDLNYSSSSESFGDDTSKLGSFGKTTFTNSLGGGTVSTSGSNQCSTPKSGNTYKVSDIEIKALNSIPQSPDLVMDNWDHNAYNYGPVTPVKVTKNLEVGAGAKISQQIYDDPERLDYWHDEPEAIICVSYCEESVVRKIIEAGEIDISGHPEGFLKSVPVGN